MVITEEVKANLIIKPNCLFNDWIINTCALYYVYKDELHILWPTDIRSLHVLHKTQYCVSVWKDQG